MALLGSSERLDRDQTHGDESDKASIEGNSNHSLNIGMEQLTCHREKTWMKQAQSRRMNVAFLAHAGMNR